MAGYEPSDRTSKRVSSHHSASDYSTSNPLPSHPWDSNHSASSLLAGRYHVQQQLGKKAGRRTLLAIDLQTQQPFILKLLLFGLDFEWDTLKLFEREATILQTLSHPAIPRYLDYLELETPNGKGFALVQTYIEARSLEEHLKAGHTFSETEIKQLASAVLTILMELHQRRPQVIHRDIKPSNILLDRSSSTSDTTLGQVYLVDFGSVQTLAAREGSTITIVGTYGYMPPEQFGGRSVSASDLYSLGATLIYLLTGHHPADLPQTNLRLEFESIAQISPALTRWLQRMTEPSLNQRFQSAEQALQALEHLEDSLAVTTALTEQIPSPVIQLPQPKGSKVVLHKQSDVLDLVLPPSGLSSELATIALFAVVVNACAIGLMAVMGVGFAPAPGLITALLYLLLSTMAGSVMLVIAAALFAQTRLHIDGNTIAFAYKVGGYEYYRHLSMRADICKLVDSRSRHSGGRRLILWTGTHPIELGNTLADPELDWLAQELSSWLGLPVHRN